MPVKLNGATSGSVQLDVPAAIGSDLQLTLPATAGDVVVKAADGSVDLGSVDIDSSGNVGIGTSSPQQFLHVHGANGRIQITSAGTGSASGDGALFGYDGTDDLFINNREATNFKIFNNGSERMRIDSSGRVGIGVTNPGKVLDLQATSGLATRFYNSSTFKAGIEVATSAGDMIGGSAVDNFCLRSQSDLLFSAGGNTERMRIDSSGVITVPDNGYLKLGTGGDLELFHNVFDSYIDNNTRDLRIRNIATNCRDLYLQAREDLRFEAGLSERLRIDSSGRVGIGTSTPTTISAGNTSLTLGPGSSGAQGSEIHMESNAHNGANNGANISYIDDTLYLVNRETGPLTFYTVATERMRIDSSGNVGIGTTTPLSDAKLTISSNDAPALAFQRTGSGKFESAIGMSGNSSLRFYVGADSGSVSGLNEAMQIDSAGNVGIGTTANTFNSIEAKANFYQGSINGKTVINCVRVGTASGRNQISFHNPNGNVGNIVTTGSATAYNTSSDYRLKENVVDIADGITRVKLLQPKRFNFIADVDTTVDGFLAHEAQTVVPEAVTGEKDGEEMQGIDQSKLVPLLTAALQEAIAKIETLETKVASLEANS